MSQMLIAPYLSFIIFLVVILVVRLNFCSRGRLIFIHQVGGFETAGYGDSRSPHVVLFHGIASHVRNLLGRGNYRLHEIAQIFDLHLLHIGSCTCCR